MKEDLKKPYSLLRRKRNTGWVKGGKHWLFNFTKTAGLYSTDENLIESMATLDGGWSDISLPKTEYKSVEEVAIYRDIYGEYYIVLPELFAWVEGKVRDKDVVPVYLFNDFRPVFTALDTVDEVRLHTDGLLEIAGKINDIEVFGYACPFRWDAWFWEDVEEIGKIQILAVKKYPFAKYLKEIERKV